MRDLPERFAGRGLLVLLVALSSPGCAFFPSHHAMPVLELAAGRRAGPIEITSDLKIHGAGETRTTLWAPKGTPVLAVPKGRQVVLENLTIEASPAAIAVVVRGTLELDHVSIRGGRAAVRIEGGTGYVDHLTVTGSGAAVEVRDGGEVTVSHLLAKNIAGGALFAAGGLLTVRGAEIDHAAYGLLVRPAGRINVVDLTVRNAHWAGVGITGGGGLLGKVTIDGAQRHGGILANDLQKPLELTSVTIRHVHGVGLQVIRGKIAVDGLTVDGVTRDSDDGLGDGVLLEDVQATIHDLRVTGAGGPGIAALGGWVRLFGGHIDKSGAAAIQAWRGARIVAHRVDVTGSGGYGLSAEEGAWIRFDGGSVKGSALGPAIADCAASSSVEVGASAAFSRALGPCVRRGPVAQAR